MSIGFDVISDLHLSSADNFNWDGKATSLFCLVAGNISGDLQVIHQVLWTLARFYQAVFYIGGNLEYDVPNVIGRIGDLNKISNHIPKVTYLHHHVVVLNGVAVLGASGRYGGTTVAETEADCVYLAESVKRLQLHKDVKRIVLVTNMVPSKDFYFGEDGNEVVLPLTLCLENDTEKKVSHWIYGQCDRNTEVTINQITYINNSAYDKKPYWPKRIELTF